MCLSCIHILTQRPVQCSLHSRHLVCPPLSLLPTNVILFNSKASRGLPQLKLKLNGTHGVLLLTIMNHSCTNLLGQDRRCSPLLNSFNTAAPSLGELVKSLPFTTRFSHIYRCTMMAHNPNRMGEVLVSSLPC